MTFVVKWFYVYWFSIFRYWLNVKDSRIQLKITWRKFIRCLEIWLLQCWRWKRDTCLQQRAWAAPALVWTTGAGAVPGGAYTTETWVTHGGVYTKGARAAPGLVWTAEACAAPGLIHTIEACAAIWRVYIVEACAAPGVVYTTVQGPELHLDIFRLQEPLLLLD